MKLALLTAVLVPSIAVAQPQITKTNWVTVDQQTVTITGTGFGEKASAAPIKFDTFEAGGDSVALYSVQPEWVPSSGDDSGALYSTNYAHSGSMSVAHTTADVSSYNSNYLTVPDTDELFTSYWFRMAEVELDPITHLPDGSGNDYGVIKLNRTTCSTTDGGIYNGPGSFSISSAVPRGPSGVDPYLIMSAEDQNYQFYRIKMKWDAWFRIDTYGKLGTYGQPDGAIMGRSVGMSELSDYSLISRSDNSTYMIDTFLLPLMVAHPTGYFEMYVDDVYVDDTRSRVEIGDDPVFGSCSHREIQIPQAWRSDGTSIEIAVNGGTLDLNGDVWLFVIDKDGIPSPGRQVLFAGPLERPSAPGKPVGT